MLSHIIPHRRRKDMEKQLDLFRFDNNCSSIWLGLPAETRQKIERIFAEVIIKQLGSSSKEVKDHEK
jgi:hypothetical protein